MKLRDISPNSYAVLDASLGNRIVAVVRTNSSHLETVGCIDGRYFIEFLSDLDARPLTKADAVEVNEDGVLRLSKPNTPKDGSIHPSELKVGQFGKELTAGDWDFVLRASSVRFIRFTNPSYSVPLHSFEQNFRVHPYPIGSKLVPQADGSIVVEEPEEKALKWADLDYGDYFVDDENDLGIKTKDGITWIASGIANVGETTIAKSDAAYKKVTPAEAAAIIAKQE